jgi:hypothetical protein
MAESDDNKPEKKPTRSEEDIDDVLWEIPFARPIWKFFVREGKAVKNGWVAVAVIVGVAVYFTHHWTNSDVDAKISDATNYFGGVISDLKGQLTDAKSDRDKYELMLAPFQAAALKIYTNAPLDQRLEILASTMNVVTNELANDKPILHLEINGTRPVAFESVKVGEMLPATPILLNTNNQIALAIYNDSQITAEHVSVDFIAAIDPTNVLADQWMLEPKTPSGENHWHLVATDSYGALEFWFPQTITISHNFQQQLLLGRFTIHADHSMSWTYSIALAFNK